MSELGLWKFIFERLQSNRPVVLMCVTESKGSSPGRHGFKMAVASDEMYGSIGGGIMEHKFVELAKEKLKELSEQTILRKQFHNKTETKNQSGMICSGEQNILLYQPGEKDLDAIKKIISCLEKNQNGELKIIPHEISFNENILPENDFKFNMKSEQEWEYIEKAGYKNKLFIIGGGHCALAFSKLMASMDFYIHLYEERNNLNTFLNNIYAHEKYVIENYALLSELIPSGSNIYVVIMTFGYRTDDIALRALMNKNFKYLGVLGSKSKIEKMFADLRISGIEEPQLRKIHAPVGIEIRSQTPEEIAVSIAGEIIKIKNSD